MLRIEQLDYVNNCAAPAHAVSLQRSKTALVVTDTRPHMYVDLERQARNDAEKAMKVLKRFFLVIFFNSLMLYLSM